ncbi:MAG: Stp1/IreP family PP2C-type Ser/Thr phosphatase [Oligoflexales bacterium]|nr:Stp1/IreP family PP2C-type Ser/Thr phosphatase [Oligoflexales bacterium]
MNKQLKANARGLTDRGLVRKTNQDAYLIDLDSKLLIVADGMGGHAGGEVASKLCIQCVDEEFHTKIGEASAESLDELTVNRYLSDSINVASTKIYEKALEEPNLKGMGTTATVVKIIEDKAYYAQVGDSRLYLLRCGFIYQLTQDHSLVSEQVAAGVISEEEAKNHQLRNVITRSVGYQEEEYVDTDSLNLEDQDFLILCSDGLHGKVGNKEIANLVLRYEVDAVDPLIDLANERGGEDNITLIILKIRCS